MGEDTAPTQESAPGTVAGELDANDNLVQPVRAALQAASAAKREPPAKR